jgi:mannosyltransferase OCH1-like enzyme
MGTLEEECLDSWRKIMPDYKLRLWDEGSIDLKLYPFAMEAYNKGKYAFVSDVVRLHALLYEGGIYLDTDILVLKKFDHLLNQKFFIGEYKKGSLNAALIGSVAGYPLFKTLLEFYQNHQFNFLKPLTIPDALDKVVWSYPLLSGTIYPPEYFYPLPFEEKGKDFSSFITENSYTVHLWNHSWKDEFGLLREDRFFSSFRMATYHSFCFPRTYWKASYLKRYGEQFYKHLKRFLKEKLDG